MGGDCLDCPLLHQVDVYCKICCQCFFVIKLQLRGADCELGGQWFGHMQCGLVTGLSLGGEKGGGRR